MTTRGRCLLAGGFAAMVCAILLDERDLLRIGVLAVALPVVALIATAGRRPSLSAARRAVPDRLRPGNSGTIELRLTNRGGWRTRPLEVVDAATPGLADGVRCLLPPLRPGATAVVRYPLLAGRRGRFVLGPTTVRVTDPFGLWSSERALPSEAGVLVVPATIPLTGMPPAAGARSAAAGPAVSGSGGGEPDVAVRHYHPGDDIRTVAWRASARRDELMVRLREPVSHGGVTVLLDHRAAAHAGVGTDTSLETAITLTASICLHVLSGDYQLRLTGHRGDVVASGNDVGDDVLVALADIEPDATDRIGPSVARGSGLAVAVLGSLTAADVATLVASRPPASRGVALLMDTTTWGAAGPSAAPGPDAAASAAALRAGGWHTAVVARGDSLATAWRMACGSGLAARRVS